jgi:phosphonate transport system substrate-binding protein
MSKGKNYTPTYSTDNSEKKVLLFGVPSQSYYEVADLFVKYLDERLQGVQIQTVASSSFDGYNEKLRAGYFQFTIANGMTALKSKENYLIIGQAIDEEGNSGAIVVNRDSSIHSLNDLKNTTIATPGFPALPGHMLQMVFLNKKGIDPKNKIRFKYLESFESVILNVYLGKCSAGFTTTTAWNSFIKRRPELASKVELRWQTPPIIGNAFLIRNTIDQQTANQVKKLVLSMHQNQDGRNALEKLGYLRFDPADSNSYQSIKSVVEEYNCLGIDNHH